MFLRYESDIYGIKSVFFNHHFDCSRFEYVMGSGATRPVARRDMTAQDIVNECGANSKVKNAHILVTGATSGIGIETGRILALAGAKVYLMGRSETKLQEVMENIKKDLQQKSSTGSVEGVICDLNSLASIKQFAEKFTREKTPLNILILNAGVLNFNYAQTVDGLEQVIGVNHIGHAYLTQLLMPTLIDNAPSRIVVVSSQLHKGPPFNYEALDRMSSKEKNAKKGWGVMRSYQQSKLANILFARALASRYNDKQITAYSLHPGVIDTNLAANIPLAGLFKMFSRQKTVEQGAATTVYCALKPDLEKETGRYFDDSTVTNLADKWTEDDINTFWQWTEKVIRERTANLS
jgi:NAD(P)-dependent dehydrogenase (short-subunit alcohol dehydrogenase family)